MRIPSRRDRPWPRRSKQRDEQRQAFGSLVNLGIYSTKFEHSPQSIQFFTECITDAFARIPPAQAASVLDCGCGAGAWLDLVLGKLQSRGEPGHQYYGFDLTPEIEGLLANAALA